MKNDTIATGCFVLVMLGFAFYAPHTGWAWKAWAVCEFSLMGVGILFTAYGRELRRMVRERRRGHDRHSEQ